MSKDPLAPDNLANLRRTLPGLGVSDGSPLQVQEVSAADVERVLAATQTPPNPNPSPASSTGVGLGGRSVSQTGIPVLAGTSNPAIPQLRGTSNPAIPQLRGTSNPAIPMFRSTSNSAMPLLRTTGNPEPPILPRASETSIPSVPPSSNRLPLLIAGLGTLALAIGVVAWLHPGQSATGSGVPADKTAVLSLPTALPTGGSQAVVPVRTVAQPAPVVVVAPAKDKPSDDKKDQISPRKPPEETGHVVTSSKPTTSPPATGNPAKPVAPKAVATKVEAKPTRAPQLDLSPVPQLTRDILRQHMTVAEPKWQACPKDGSGKYLTIGIAVAPSGSVVKAEVMGPAGSTQTAQCITERIRGMRFPAYSEGGPKNFVWSYQVP